MARERDAGHSFDPRTWGGEARPRPAAGRSGAASPTPTAAASSAAPRPASAGTSSTIPVWLAFGASALLLGAGAVVARLHPSTADIAVAAAVPAAPSPMAVADDDHRTLTVADPAAIADTLRAAGVTADVADGAAREVATMLVGAVGDITLVIDLTGPAAAREMTRLEATRGTGGVVLTARPDGSYRSEPLPARLGSGM